MNRTESSAKNAAWSLTYILATNLMGFVTRTVFMAQLGERWLGLSGLFTSILGLLSFAELGLGAALGFSLYKPVAQNNEAEIKAILQFTRRVFRVVMLVVTLGGLAIMPFLHLFVDSADGIDHLYLYYGIYLVNTVASYMLTYKTLYMTARQEAWRTVKITIFFWALTAAFQLVVLVVYPNYLLYLVSTITGTLLDKIFQSLYLNRKYPIVKKKTDDPPPPEVVATVKRNIKGLMAQKLGTIVVNSTDNILISRFIGLAVTGIVENYTLLRATVLTVLTTFSNAILPSMGNLAVTESKETQLEVFRIYNMLRFWVVGLCFCGLATLSTPFVSLWLGSTVTIDGLSVFLICLNLFLYGQHTSIDMLREANGMYHIGRLLSIVEAAANLVLSLVFVLLMGLPGIYVGTVLSCLLQYCFKPVLVLRGIYGEGAGWYFRQCGVFAGVALFTWAVLRFAAVYVLSILTWRRLILMGLITVAFTLCSFWLFLHRSPAYKAGKGLVVQYVKQKLGKKK